MKKSLFKIILCMAAIALLLAGCGGTQVTPPAKTDPGTSTGVTEPDKASFAGEELSILVSQG